MQFGDFQIRTVSGGRFRLDGGAMFGVVPRPLWENVSPPDERNRIRLNTNCLLVETDRQKVLIDTGYGSKLSDKQQLQLASEPGNPLVENLAKIGIVPQQIDFVIFSHLHFDHAGGATFADQDGQLKLTFPNATHVINETEWEDAVSNKSWLKGNYDARELLPIDQGNALQTVGDSYEVIPGIVIHQTGGHTRGHQMIEVKGDAHSAFYLGDICPTSSHLRNFWTMAYDICQEEVRIVKPKILEKIVKSNSLLFFDHDPDIRAAKLKQDDKMQCSVSDLVAVDYSGSE